MQTPFLPPLAVLPALRQLRRELTVIGGGVRVQKTPQATLRLLRANRYCPWYHLTSARWQTCWRNRTHLPVTAGTGGLYWVLKRGTVPAAAPGRLRRVPSAALHRKWPLSVRRKHGYSSPSTLSLVLWNMVSCFPADVKRRFRCHRPGRCPGNRPSGRCRCPDRWRTG